LFAMAPQKMEEDKLKPVHVENYARFLWVLSLKTHTNLQNLFCKYIVKGDVNNIKRKSYKLKRIMWKSVL
jgi:hypothetical protein